MGSRVRILQSQTRARKPDESEFLSINRPAGCKSDPDPCPNRIKTHQISNFGYPLPSLAMGSVVAGRTRRGTCMSCMAPGWFGWCLDLLPRRRLQCRDQCRRLARHRPGAAEATRGTAGLARPPPPRRHDLARPRPRQPMDVDHSLLVVEAVARAVPLPSLLPPPFFSSAPPPRINICRARAIVFHELSSSSFSIAPFPSLPLGTRRAGGRLGNRNYRETTLLEARPLPLLPSIIYIAEEPATGF